MKSLLCQLFEMERAIGVLVEKKDDYKTYYKGYLQGLREARILILKNLFIKEK